MYKMRGECNEGLKQNRAVTKLSFRKLAFIQRHEVKIFCIKF